MSRRASRVRASGEFRRLAIAAVRDFLAALTTVTVANRVVRLVLLIAGLSVPEVRRLTEAPASSLRTLARCLESLADGSEAESLLIDGRSRSGRRNPLDGDVGEMLLEELSRENYFDLSQIRRWLEERLRVRACEQTVSAFLRAHGIRKLKAGSIPAKANPEEQASFWREVIRPLMEAAAEEGSKTALLFVDASHFVISCDFLGSIWCSSRRFIKTFSGRQRHNVLGALDWATKKIVAVTNDTYVNAETFLELLEKVAREYEGMKVHMVLDNVRYQRCKMVQDKADELGIKLEFLPTYSPNLNPIERVWRMVKSDLRRSRWDDFAGFCKVIDDLVASTDGANRERVETLVGENVQLFDGHKELFENVVEAPPRKKKAKAATS